MKRMLLVLASSAVVAVALTADLRQGDVPKDRVPWELAEPSLKSGHWWDVPHIPLDHPYWWTVSDALTPGELRERLQQRHLKLQLEAAEEMRRVVAERSTEAPQRTSAWIVDGQETPELFAVWDAYHAFSSVMVARKTKEEQERELVEFGIEPSAAAQIVTIAEQIEAKQIELWQETFRAGQEVRKLLSIVAARRGSGEVQRIRDENDIAALAAVSGRPIAEVQETARLSSRDTIAEATVPRMVELRSIIGDEQWNLFRRYLLTEVTPHMSKSVVFRSKS